MPDNTSPNRAILSVHAKLPNPGHQKPNRYLGVVELSELGFNTVEVVIATGVRDFPSCPYMATIPTDDTFVEFRKGKIPVMNVNEWEPFQHYYY